MSPRQMIGKYYECMSEKIKEPLFHLLDEYVIVISDYAFYNNRDKMIEDVWPHVGQNKVQDLKIFGERDRFMVKYRLKGQRLSTMAEYIEFTNKKITRIEIYSGFEPPKQIKALN